VCGIGYCHSFYEEKTYYCTNRNTSQSSAMDPIIICFSLIFTTYFRKVHFNIIPPCTRALLQDVCSHEFLPQSYTRIIIFIMSISSFYRKSKNCYIILSLSFVNLLYLFSSELRSQTFRSSPQSHPRVELSSSRLRPYK
jgi:hypothetical protein